MKKADFLKKLEDSIWFNGAYKTNVQPETLEQMAVGVLKDIEKLGMQPPHVGSDKCQYLMHKYMECSCRFID